MLTVKWLDGRLNKPQEREIVKAHRYGMSARVRKTGKITFIFKYRWQGRTEKITIGSYPELSIGKASDIAKDHQNTLAEDKNPKKEKLVARLEVEQQLTVEQLLMRWWHHHFKNHASYNDEINGYPFAVKRSFQLHVFPKLGAYPWDKVDRQQWAKLFLENRDKRADITKRMVTCVKQAASFGIGNGIIKEHPLMEYTAKKTLGLKSKKRQRHLNDDEIFKIYEAIDNSRTKPGNKILMKLLIIYGCRTIELRLCKPEHLDIKNGVWTVPPEIAKPKNSQYAEDHKPIIRPLFKETIELFKLAMAIQPKSAYVFPKENGEPMKPAALTDMPDRISVKINKAYDQYKMEPWSKHDLRRTLRTRMGKLTQYHVAEKMLGHVMPGEGDTYDQELYLEEQLIAYQKWYQVLDNIWNQRDNVTVIGIKKGA